MCPSHQARSNTQVATRRCAGPSHRSAQGPAESDETRSAFRNRSGIWRPRSANPDFPDPASESSPPSRRPTHSARSSATESNSTAHHAGLRSGPASAVGEFPPAPPFASAAHTADSVTVGPHSTAVSKEQCQSGAVSTGTESHIRREPPDHTPAATPRPRRQPANPVAHDRGEFGSSSPAPALCDPHDWPALPG